MHRILCTDLQEVTDTAIVSGSRIFIGSQKQFCKAAMGAGFVLAARFQGNHAGESLVSSSAVNLRRIQNGVHNSGTTRLHMRRLTRLTLAFSKKRENFEAAVGLHFAYYNFVKRHNTIRCTPAMAAGVERDFWSVGDLVEAAA